jgi:hypothetical protein
MEHKMLLDEVFRQAVLGGFSHKWFFVSPRSQHFAA